MTATPPATAAPSRAVRPAHRDPGVLRWVGAYTASTLGDSVYHLALAWAAVSGGSPGQAGLVMAVAAVPRALLLLGGGVVADRLGPRRVVIGSDAVRCVVVLGLAATLLVASPGLWVLAAVALVFGAVDALFLPAVGALPPRIAARDQLARVQGMRGLAQRLGAVVGAPLGGLAVAVGGPSTAFGLAGLLFAFSLPLLGALRLRPLPVGESTGTGSGTGTDTDTDTDTDTGTGTRTGSGTALGDLAAGLRYLRGHRLLGPLMVIVLLSDLGFVGPLNVGLAVLAEQRGWGASGIGWILAGFGTGAGAASLVLTVRGRVPRAGLVSGWTMLLGAAAIAALGHAAPLPAAVGLALAVGLFAGLSGALCTALLQTACDPAYLGRVTAVAGLCSLGLAPLTFPLTGTAIGLWGPGPVYGVSAAVCALSGVYGLVVTSVRKAELPG
ncbi:MFS transporter [Streptomyces sp. NPDC006339]|uniref:MFS transporter n=1 Tax=Streptomyces sp. NPDC006339 TaxID=3156755 RepID=UPI0033A286DB